MGVQFVIALIAMVAIISLKRFCIVVEWGCMVIGIGTIEIGQSPRRTRFSIGEIQQRDVDIK